MGGEIRGGKESIKVDREIQGKEAEGGARSELPLEAEFLTLGADLKARHRFEAEARRNALELEFNRAFEQFQNLASRHPGERGEMIIPGYRPLTVEGFLFGITWAEKALSGLRASKGTAQGTSTQPALGKAEVADASAPKTTSRDGNLAVPATVGSSQARLIRISDPNEFIRAVQEGTEGPDILVIQGRNTSHRIDSYYTKMKNFDKHQALVVDTYSTRSGHWEMTGTFPIHEIFINSTDPDLVLKIHRALVEKCIETGSEQEAWLWLVQESPYAHLLKEMDSDH